MEEEEEDKGSMESTQTVSKEKKPNASASSQDQQMFQKILKKNRAVLVKNANFSHFKEHLMQEDLLTWKEIEDIEADIRRYKQMERFLDIMERKTDSSVEKLLNILKEEDPILYEQLNLSVTQADVVPAGHDEQENPSHSRGNNDNECVDTIRPELQDWYIYTTSRLRPIPWGELLEIDLDHVFTNLDLVRGQKNEICPRVKSEFDDINQLNNLFNKGPHRRSVCFVEGPAGIGKSTLCRHLVYMWSKNNFTIADYSFVFAFLLEARILTEDLKMSIKQQLFPEDFELSEDDIYKCLQKHQKTCLIIIDGVDELTLEGKTTVMKLLRGEMLRHVNLVLTGRPEASRCFLKHSNLHLKITGFTNENVVAYICKFFCSHSLKARLIKRVVTDDKLRAIMTNPFITLLVCLLFKDKNGTLPRVLTDIQWEVLEICCRKYITKIKNSNTLDMTQETLLSAAAHLAYEGYRRSLTAYQEESIASLMRPNDSVEHLLKSGILGKDFTVSRLNAKGFYFFPHKSFQELLCAKYLSERDNEKFEEKLKPIFQLDPRLTALNMIQNLLNMLQSKRNTEVVVESLCQKVEINTLNLSSVVKLIEKSDFAKKSWNRSDLTDFLSVKISKSERLVYKMCRESFGRLNQYKAYRTCVKKSVQKMRFPPVAFCHHLLAGMCPIKSPSKILYLFRKHTSMTRVYLKMPKTSEVLVDQEESTGEQTLADRYWPFVHCLSVDAAVKLLKCGVKVNVLTICITAIDCPQLLTTKRLLKSAKNIVFLFLDSVHHGESFLTFLSVISSLENVVFLKIKHKPCKIFDIRYDRIKGRGRVKKKRYVWYDVLLDYDLDCSINQMHYNKFSAY